VIANFCPTNRLRRVDFPLLGGPMIATKPDRKPIGVRDLYLCLSALGSNRVYEDMGLPDWFGDFVP
jgi:hypothetical protein